MVRVIGSHEEHIGNLPHIPGRVKQIRLRDK